MKTHRQKNRRMALPLMLSRLEPVNGISLQNQIRQKLIEAILRGVFPPGKRLPSSRMLANRLGVARNTVVLAYQQLVAEGHLSSRERSGIYVNEDVVKGRLRFEKIGGPAIPASATEWRRRMKARVEDKDQYRVPPDWQKYPFPFIEGRFDNSLFPIKEWREANRLALGVNEVHNWAADSGDIDDTKLIEEIRTKVLPRRGITARADEILITAGTQQALHLVTELLVDSTTNVAIEEPGNITMHQLLEHHGGRLVHQRIDEYGIIVDQTLDKCDLVYVTPSHQRPTAVTLSMERRKNLLAKARACDFVIIEDDFECETNYLDEAYPALRSLDGGDRVIYVANLSRVLAPGLRLGFMLAPPEVITQARRLRSLTTRHPPLNNQRTAALFISLGHYDATMLRLGRIFQERLLALRDALNHYLPQSIAISPVRGGTTYWVRGPQGLDARDLAREAESRGVIIEPVCQYYATKDPPNNILRMGVTGIPVERIRAGVATLAVIIRELTGGTIPRIDIHSAAPLQGDELRRAMAGATLLCKTVYGDPCTIELRRDGTMTGRAGYANEDRDQGRWWIEDDLWCRQWEVWAYGEPSSFYTRITGDRIQWFNAQGHLIDTAVYVRAGKRKM